MTDSPQSRRDSAGRKWLARLSILAAAASLLHPVATVFARETWVFELISHFQVAALACTALAALAWLIPRPRWQAAVLGLLAAWQMEPLLRYSTENPVPADASSSDRLRILCTNVMVDNPDPSRLGQLILDESPDVVGFIEVPEGWLDRLGEIRRGYPFRYEHPNGSKGLALWFKALPLSVDPPARVIETANPHLKASLSFAGRARNLWLVHPLNPFDRDPSTPGGEELQALASAVQQVGGSTVVIGDMNSTEGSPYFGDLVRISGLRDSRIGFGRQPSWPTWFPYRLPIDHALVSGDLSVVDRRLGPDIGSDHFPLILELAPAVTRRRISPTSSDDQASSRSTSCSLMASE